jgi:LuxR family maltose regulon positive regulatory protein
MIGSSYLGLIRIMFSTGQLAVAERYIHMIEALAQKVAVPPWITSLADSWRARLWLAQGNYAGLSAWAAEQERDPQKDITYVRETSQVETARYYIDRRRLDEAQAILGRLIGPAQQYGRTWRVIEIFILQALAYQAAGDDDQALAALEQALVAAEPGGFTRIFVDEGPPLADLLYEADTRGIQTAYVNKLLQAFSPPHSELRTPHSSTSDIPHPTSHILEPLSDRELEVLALIAQGLTNSQIADRLYLSLHTVKAHTRNIYSKLDVHTRTQAVAHARDLGLIG